MAGGGSGAGGELSGGELSGGELATLYRWLDTLPLSRPRRNIARDFSDGVLTAEVVKFFFPAMVQLHSYVPTSSTAQKLANWGHLNRKVLQKLGFCVPEELLREVAGCRAGAVEQILVLLRQKIREKQRQKQSKEVPRPGQEQDLQAALEEGSYLETGTAGGGAQESPKAGWVTKGHQGGGHGPPGDPTARSEVAEKDQALRLAQESIQILQLKVGRLEQLLLLKNLRIDDLSRRLREAQGHPP
ncbi:sperm flagellar protein 1 isoform X2 [Heliangelus exortis]|uniref:sperm flagellar protein 1 isoform X2 n=1 Tax=Heliangelus exortis TaxID=472823 RepID=UPI003A8E4E2D